MKKLGLIVTLLVMTGCTMFMDPATRRDRELTRRYTICMKEQLGPFSGFASPESRRKAAESCQPILTPEQPN